MSQIMISQSASSEPMKSYEVDSLTTPATEARQEGIIINFEERSSAAIEAPAKHKTIKHLMDELKSDESLHAELEKARSWVADEFYAEDGDTIRTTRLRNGWSQAQLASKLETSQSHVARIERGKENLQISTCRKLCRVFGIDMNTLDALLRRQEAIFAEKQQ